MEPEKIQKLLYSEKLLAENGDNTKIDLIKATMHFAAYIESENKNFYYLCSCATELVKLWLFEPITWTVFDTMPGDFGLNAKKNHLQNISIIADPAADRRLKLGILVWYFKNHKKEKNV